MLNSVKLNSRSAMHTANKTVKIGKIAQKRRFLHNYANYAGKEKKTRFMR